MHFNMGVDGTALAKDSAVPCVVDFSKTINPHVVVLGDSGVGKSHLLRRMVRQLVETSKDPVRIHLFDSHGDIETAYSSTVLFSQTAPAGLNPLHVNPHPDFGGVRRAINAFIQIINRTRKLGVNQEACLRNILTDMYANFGMFADNPDTWVQKERKQYTNLLPDRIYLDVRFSEIQAAARAGCEFDKVNKLWWHPDHTGASACFPKKNFTSRYPTMVDLLATAQNNWKRVYLGANGNSMKALDEVNARSRKLHSEFKRQCQQDLVDIQVLRDMQANDEQLKKLKLAALRTYENFLDNIITGKEVDNAAKYDSQDVIESVIRRIQALNEIGIFKDVTPSFDPSMPVRRYNISPLTKEERLLFVEFSVTKMFNDAVERGPTNRIHDIIIIDEAAQYIQEDSDSILNRLIREARKFGLGLILASQTPEHLSSDLLSQVATKIILGLDQSQWPIAHKKMGIDATGMKWCQPKKRAILQTKVADHQGTKGFWVVLPNGEQQAQEESTFQPVASPKDAAPAASLTH